MPWTEYKHVQSMSISQNLCWFIPMCAAKIDVIGDVQSFQIFRSRSMAATRFSCNEIVKLSPIDIHA